MRIATNTTSFNVWTSYTKNLSNLQSSMSKLSTGTIANTDDPAGVGIADRMQAQIDSTQQAYKNGENAVSLFQTADSWLSQINDDLSRMKELGVQAQGITSADDVENLQTEYESLQEEITRITSKYTAAAKFNGLYLFRGGTGVAVVTGDKVATGNISVQIGADIDQTLDLDLADLQVTNSEVIGTVHTYVYGGGEDAARAVLNTHYTAAVDNYVSDGFSRAEAEAMATAGINSLLQSVADGTTSVHDAADVACDAMTAVGPADSGENRDILNVILYDPPLGLSDWDVNDPSPVFGDAITAYSNSDAEGNSLVSSTHTAVHWSSIIDVNMTSVGSTNIVGALDNAINFVAAARASMGAQQSRVQKTDDALLTYQDNLESAKSKISDIDMAAETTAYSTYNVLTQSANAMLAQANQLPSSMVLQLIQG